MLIRHPFVPSGAPPPGYAAGLGRGASAFTTRADLGVPAAATPVIGRGRGRGLPPTPSSLPPHAPSGESAVGAGAPAGGLFGSPPPGYIPGRGRGATGFAGGVSRDDATEDRDRGDYSDTNYDEFSGYSEGLFRDSEYDAEDFEADSVYNSVEERMDMRRKSRREQRFKSEIAKLRAEKPTLSQQFSDLKRGLQNVSAQEWEAIPDIGDYTLKSVNKSKKQRVAPAPDSLLIAAQARNATQISISPGSLGGETPVGLGLQTPLPLARTPLAGLATPATPRAAATPSLNDLGEARGTVLSVKLDKVMDSVSGQTVVDPKGYLTDLNSLPVSTDANIADIKKARLLLRSVIQTNPGHAPGWIAAARLEELAGQLSVARELIAQGCQQCPKNEDVWLEAARLEKPKEAKAILASGVKQNPHSIKLWLEAANREREVQDKKKVFRKALQFTPNSVRLWKEAVALEEPSTARVLLARAVECVPQSVEMWLSLARLSSYHDAQKVLNEARKRVPTSSEIWVSAAKLEESQGNAALVERLISRGLENLSAKGVSHDRDAWLKHAEEAEQSGHSGTCEAIIKKTMNLGVEDVNRKRIWVGDAENALSRGLIKTARALYANALETLSHAEAIWMALVEIDAKHGTPDLLENTLAKAVAACPASEALWLRAAKQKSAKGDTNAARALLAEAFRHVVNKETVSLAAVALERDVGEFERARLLLERARSRCTTSEKLWVQSVQLERMLQNWSVAATLANQALEVLPKSSRLWMIAGQIQLEKDNPDRAAAVSFFEKGRTECPRSVELWLCAVDLLRADGNWAQARALLEEARLRNPKQELLWLAAVEIEILASGTSRSEWNLGHLGSGAGAASGVQIAHHLMTKALQECPKSGILWAEAIFLEAKAAQNAKSVDALTACENDANVILAVGKQFWRAGKLSKARRWIERAITINPKLGDAYVTYLHLELNHGDDSQRLKIVEDCAQAKPNQGLLWNRVVKQVSNWRLSYPEKLRVALESLHPDALTSTSPSKKPIGNELMDLLHGRSSLKSEAT